MDGQRAFAPDAFRLDTHEAFVQQNLPVFFRALVAARSLEAQGASFGSGAAFWGA